MIRAANHGLGPESHFAAERWLAALLRLAVANLSHPAAPESFVLFLFRGSHLQLLAKRLSDIGKMPLNRRH